MAVELVREIEQDSVESFSGHRMRQAISTRSNHPVLARIRLALRDPRSHAPDLVREILRLRITRFGLVGISATATLSAAYMSFVSLELLTPFLANLVAYLIAFAVSFLGHRHWTFGDAEKGGRNAYAIFRFLAVSLTALAINSAAVLLLVNHLALPVWTPLIVFIGVTPLFTFLMNRFWVFFTLR